MLNLSPGGKSLYQQVFRTQRLELRAFRLSDYDAWAESYLSRQKPKSRFDIGPTKKSALTRAAFRKVISRHQRLAKTDDAYIFAAFERRTGKHIGGVDLKIIARGMYQMANLGYQLHNGFWGKGYASEASRKALAIGFEKLGIHRIEVSIEPSNRRSLRVAKALGMRREGLRKAYVQYDGHWWDQIVFALVAEDHK